MVPKMSMCIMGMTVDRICLRPMAARMLPSMMATFINGCFPVGCKTWRVLGESFLKLYHRDVNQIVHDGVDGEACRAVDLQLAGYVAAVGYDRVGRYAEVVGNLLV